MQVLHEGFPDIMKASDHQAPTLTQSAPMDLIWEKFSARVDVLLQPGQECPTRAETDPDATHAFKPSTGAALPSSPDQSFRIRTPDRLLVDLAEYRRGYCYSVDTTPESKSGAPGDADAVMTPRRALDKEDSNDFSSFAGLREGPGTAALFSPPAGMVSSPFAAATRQPFADHVSCRSNLSDYGYTTASDEEEDVEEEEGVNKEEHCLGCAEGAPPPPPEEGMGFWAEVGACGEQATKGMPTEIDERAACATAPFWAPSGEVCWDVNDWDSGSDTSEQPDEDMGDVHQQQAGPTSPGILLPWDME